MANYGKAKKTRSRREESVQAEVQLPRKHRKYLLALLEACILEGVPAYIGRQYRDGKLQFKVFTEREIVEDFIRPDDDPTLEIVAMATDTFGERVGKLVSEQGAAYEALAAAQSAKKA